MARAIDKERLRGRVARALVQGLVISLVALAPGAVGAVPLGESQRAALERALRSADEQSFHFARRLAGEVGDPVALTLVRWLELARGRERLAFSAYRDFIRRHPDWPEPRSLQIRAEEAIDDTVPADEILDFFADRQPITRPGRIRLAEALWRAGERERATLLLRAAWHGGDFTASDEAAFLARHGGMLRPEDHAQRLEHLLSIGQPAAAERLLRRVDAGRRALAEARIRLQRDQGGVDAAIARVPAALRNDPGLLLDRVRWRRQKGFDDGAAELLREVRAEPAVAARFWPERERQVRRLLREGRHRLAYELASGHGQESGVGFAEAEWLAGWLALRFLARPEDAHAHFDRLFHGVGTPISRSRGAYWAGRAADVMGEDDLALRWWGEAAVHGIAFYGQLARGEIEARGLPVVVPAAAAPSPDAAARAAFAGRETVRAVRLLAAAGSFELPRSFLARLTSDAADEAELVLVVELARAIGRPDLMARSARAAAAGGMVLEEAGFPLPAVHGLLYPVGGVPDPSLLLAVARQESLFDPMAVSRAGARGILQLMPATAQGVARTLGLPYSERRLLSDPEYNVRLGAHYLHSQIARFGGEPVMALAAYNAGPSRVVRWLEEHGDPRGQDLYTLIDWIERIPFSETRNYVQRVLEADHVYRRRLADPAREVVVFGEPIGPRIPPPSPGLRPRDS